MELFIVVSMTVSLLVVAAMVQHYIVYMVPFCIGTIHIWYQWQYALRFCSVIKEDVVIVSF